MWLLLGELRVHLDLVTRKEAEDHIDKMMHQETAQLGVERLTVKLQLLTVQVCLPVHLLSLPLALPGSLLVVLTPCLLT